jgi:hypothetical protein
MESAEQEVFHRAVHAVRSGDGLPGWIDTWIDTCELVRLPVADTRS